MSMKNEVYNCDCIEYMKTLPKGYFQLAIADPPYGGAGNEQIDGGGQIWSAVRPLQAGKHIKLDSTSPKDRMYKYRKTLPPPTAATQPRQRRKIRAIRRSRGKVHRLGCGTKAGVFRRAVSCGQDGHHLGWQLLSAASHKVLPDLGQETARGFQYGNV